MLAALLSVYVDDAGHFTMTPMRILRELLVLVESPTQREHLAKNIVEFLRREDWIRNVRPSRGLAGDWYLDVKRLGGIDDAVRRAQAAVIAAGLQQRYDPYMIELIVAALQSGAS